MNKLSALQINSVEVRTDKAERLSLTDLWRAAGSPNKKDPSTWQTRESTSEFIEAVEILITPKVRGLELIIAKTGRYGGTFAHKQIALAYAKYLSPELHYAVNQVFFERLEEKQNPELAIDRAVRDWKTQGKDDNWIGTRLRSRAQRSEFTATLKHHGVANHGPKDNGYRACTNAIYSPLFGGDTSTIRHKKQLSKKDNIRNNLGSVELAAVMLSEAMAAENIKTKSLHGNNECAKECQAVSANVARAVVVSQRNQPRNTR